MEKDGASLESDQFPGQNHSPRSFLLAYTMVTNLTLLLIFVTLTSVTAQTFQYSRGWTNGKRDGHKKTEDLKEIASNLEKILSPCQMNKLKYVLEGKPVNEKLFVPCDYIDEDEAPKHFRNERTQDPLFEVFQ